jgi:hypothetical protein
MENESFIYGPPLKGCQSKERADEMKTNNCLRDGHCLTRSLDRIQERRRVGERCSRIHAVLLPDIDKILSGPKTATSRPTQRVGLGHASFMPSSLDIAGWLDKSAMRNPRIGQHDLTLAGNYGTQRYGYRSYRKRRKQAAWAHCNFGMCRVCICRAW